MTEPIQQSKRFHLRKQRHCQTLSRGGYSLLEMLLALGLMTILVSAVSIAISAFSQISVKGHTQRLQSSTISCLVDDLVMDIKATKRGNISPRFESTVTAADSLTSNLEVGTERILRWDNNPQNRYVSLVGNASALLITRDGENPRFPRPLGEEQSADSPLPVLWMSPSTSRATLAAEISGSQHIDRTFIRPEDGPGLLRAYVSGRQLRTTLSALDVKELQFRYWDGNRWIDSWDGRQHAHELPWAIEIRIQLSSTPGQWQRIVCTLQRPVDIDGNQNQAPKGQP